VPGVLTLVFGWLASGAGDGGTCPSLTQAMTLAVALYLFKMKVGCGAATGCEPHEAPAGHVWIRPHCQFFGSFWASAAALGLALSLISCVVSGKFGLVRPRPR
jgi:urea transport system permease protein